MCVCVCVAEELLAEIAAARGQPVGLTSVRSAIMRLAGVPESAFQVERGGPHSLRVLPRWQLKPDLVARLNRVTPTVAIIPSGHPPSCLTVCLTD